MMQEYGEVEYMGIPSQAEQAFDGMAGQGGIKVVFVTFGGYKRVRQMMGPIHRGFRLFY